ncbi:MAG: efflux RND transporter permease subunit [Polyangiales bacterium]
MSRGQGPGWLTAPLARPVTVVVGLVLVVLFGGLAGWRLPVQLTPDVSVPQVSVTTDWPGAAPLEVESEILELQEEALKNVPQLSRIESTASSGRGQITLEFAVGTALQEAVVQVANRLGQVPRYPEAAREPVIKTASGAGPPLAVITLQRRDKSTVAGYRSWVLDHVVPQLERVAGVAEVRLVGGRDSEVQVDFDPGALAARGLRLSQVKTRLQAALRNVSAGDIRVGKRQLQVRTPLAPAAVASLGEVVLGVDQAGVPMRLGDVAQVRMGLRRRTSVAMTGHDPYLVMLLSREAGSNVLAVTDAIKAKVKALQVELLDAQSLVLDMVSDQSRYIRSALEVVQRGLWLGAVLAVAVLLLFLRSWRAALLISTAIPVCVFGTALGLAAFGRTLNVVSLAGVTFAVGMVLDNSIVALESIERHRQEGLPARTAAGRGISEVWAALLASTLTTAAVFVPIALWQGEVGELLRDVAVAVAAAVLVSFAVSVLAIPSLSAWLFEKAPLAVRAPTETPTGGAEAAQTPHAAARLRQRGQVQLLRAKAQLLRAVTWAGGGRWRPWLLTGGSIAVALLGVRLLWPEMEYLPKGNRNLLLSILTPPAGYAPSAVEEVGRQFAAHIEPHTGQRRGGIPVIRRSFFVATAERAFAGVQAQNPNELPALTRYLRTVQQELVGVRGITSQASLFGRRIGSGRGIELELYGHDFDALAQSAGALMTAISKALPGAGVRPIPSLDARAPEIRAEPKRRVLAELGLAAPELALTIDALVDGSFVGEYGPPGEYKRDVILRATSGGLPWDPDRSHLHAAPVATPSGEVVPLGTVAHFVRGQGPTQIRRLERQRAITLQINPPEEQPLESAIAVMQHQVLPKVLAVATRAKEVRARLSGTVDSLTRAKTRLVWVLGLAMLICYLLLAAIFEHFLWPLPVLITLPLAAAGGLLALSAVDLFYTRQPLDMMGAMGFVILIGVVVNNAILVVDGARLRLQSGAPLKTALREAVQQRLRPIFMTTLTSLAGLLPLVLATGSDSELYRGIGSIVLGGLALSTGLTIFVVPAAIAALTLCIRKG